VSRRLTRQRSAPDRGSSAVEFSLMVAAMAAMILAVVLGVGHVVGDVFFRNCQQFSAQLDAGGACVAPGPAAGDNGRTGHAPAGSAGQGADDDQPRGTNDLGSSSDDM
jgi:pilus assembly protein Flp/PilA